MTYPYPPSYPPYPPPPVPPRQPNYAKVVALVAIGLLPFLMLGIGVFVYQLRHSNPGGGSATTRVQPSTQDEWLAAVCRPGSLRSDYGTRLPNAVSGEFCVSSVDGLAIDIGQYNSEYAARNDGMGQYTSGSYAIVRDTDGWMLFRNINDKTGASLQSLAQFGFTITPAGGA